VLTARPAFGPSLMRTVALLIAPPLVDVTVPESVNVVGAGGAGGALGAVGFFEPLQADAAIAATRINRFTMTPYGWAVYARKIDFRWQRRLAASV